MGSDLAVVIKSIESSGRPHALRFEPNAFQKWAWTTTMERIKEKHSCSKDTARMIACTSWGLYQLMGINVFDPHMPVDPADIFAFVADPDLQDAFFAAFLKVKGIDFTLDEILGDDFKMSTFVRTYNGPNNIAEYSALIRQHANVG